MKKITYKLAIFFSINIIKSVNLKINVVEHNACLAGHARNQNAFIICKTAGYGCTGTGNYRRDDDGTAIPEIIEQPSRPPVVFDYVRSVGFIVGEGAIKATNNGEEVKINKLIMPEADFYDYSDQGDHYEESNSTGPKAIKRIHEAALDMIE